MFEINKKIRDSIPLLALNSSQRAGNLILNFYQNANGNSESHITNQIKNLSHLVMRSIEEIMLLYNPHIPVIHEDNVKKYSKQPSVFWLVDPLDIKSSYFGGNEDISVNLALIENHRPVFGLIACPIQKTIYIGGRTLGFSYKLPIIDNLLETKETKLKINPINPKTDKIKIAISRSTLDSKIITLTSKFKQKGIVCEIKELTSLLKIGLLLDNDIDLCRSNVNEPLWKISAAQAIIDTAGGVIVDNKTMPIATKDKYYLSSGYWCSHNSLIDLIDDFGIFTET